MIVLNLVGYEFLLCEILKEIMYVVRFIDIFFFVLICNLFVCYMFVLYLNVIFERLNFMKDLVNCVFLGCEVISKLGCFVIVFKIYE